MGPAEGGGRHSLRSLMASMDAVTAEDAEGRFAVGRRVPICLEGRLQAGNYGSQICTYLGLLLKRLGFKYHPITHTCPATWEITERPVPGPGAHPLLREEVPTAGPALPGEGWLRAAAHLGHHGGGSRGSPAKEGLQGALRTGRRALMASRLCLGRGPGSRPLRRRAQRGP